MWYRLLLLDNNSYLFLSIQNTLKERIAILEEMTTLKCKKPLSTPLYRVNSI